MTTTDIATAFVADVAVDEAAVVPQGEGDAKPCTCVRLTALYGMPTVCRWCVDTRREVAQAEAFAALEEDQQVRVMAYGRPIDAIVTKVNRVSFVVDGLRLDGGTYVVDTSVACGYKVTARDIVLPRAVTP